MTHSPGKIEYNCRYFILTFRTQIHKKKFGKKCFRNLQGTMSHRPFINTSSLKIAAVYCTVDCFVKSYKTFHYRLRPKGFCSKRAKQKNVAIDSFFWQNEKEYLANNSTSQGNSKALRLPPEAEFMNVQFR
jgi:hypothetical protein